MPKVLIAEDQPEIRRLLVVNLLARRYEVMEASDGQECLAMIEQGKPDIILLDLTMPVLSGWAVLEALQRRAVLSDARVIVLTGWDDNEIRVQARCLGATDALVKPFGVDELVLTIEMALSEVGQ